MSNAVESNSRLATVVILYPFGIAIASLFSNYWLFDIPKLGVALPSEDIICVLVIVGVLFLINHSWLMTVTELTRGKYKMYATPEEWLESGTIARDAPEDGRQELERIHNAHRNTTENTVYFLLVSVPFIFIQPEISAAITWLIGFGVARLGYTYSYLFGKDGARGLFMTLGLFATFSIASYLLISLLK